MITDVELVAGMLDAIDSKQTTATVYAVIAANRALGCPTTAVRGSYGTNTHKYMCAPVSSGKTPLIWGDAYGRMVAHQLPLTLCD